MKKWIFLGMFLAGCSTTTEPAIDAGYDAAITPCLSSSAPTELSLAYGQRLVLDRSTLTTASDAVFTGEGSVRVFDLPASNEVVVRATYDAGAASIHVQCGEASGLITLQTTPLAFRNVATWTGSNGPIGREYFTWWRDEAQASKLWLFGGFVYQPVQFTPSSELWSFDLTTATWTAHGVLDGAPTTPGGRIARGLTPNTMLYFGGVTPSNETPAVLRTIDLGANPPAWSDAAHGNDAPGSYTGALLHDEERNRWLSVCGASDTFGLNCSVHAYTSEDGWSLLPVASGPRAPGRMGFAYALDAANDRVIVFAGQSGPDNLDIAADTWALQLDEDPIRWTRLFENDANAIARRNAAFAYDSDDARLFVWGGTPDGADSVPGMQVLHLDRDHEEWFSFETPSEMPSRTSGGGIYDPDTRTIYWGFGNDDAVYRDVWEMRLAPTSSAD